LYQLWRRASLAGDALQLLHRRIITMVLLAWPPLLLLSIAQGQAWGGSVELPFLHDVELHVRMLIALPLLVVAELVVHARMRLMVGQFVERGLIADEASARFDAIIAAAMRLRNSAMAEMLMIAFVYIVGVAVTWRALAELGLSSWYGVSDGIMVRPTPAGWWLLCVSLPLFQFLLLRWFFRLFIWARFLWQVSRLELRLMPMHPDRCGGLGFLGQIPYAFLPLLVALGAVVAGWIASRILAAGASLTDFKVELAGTVAVSLFAVLAPMLVFVPNLAAAKRAGMREYGSLAQRYAREFDRKWLRGGAPADEPLIGSADIQSLADLGNSFEVVKGMRPVPFNLQTVAQMAVATLLPVAPLLLTMFSLEEVLLRLAKIVF
jgi:hypothetical protein